MARWEAVVAMDRTGTIGNNGGLPWTRLPRDLARFRRLTWGYPIVMGRRTWESLGCRALDGRANIVLSRSDRSLAGGFPFWWNAIGGHDRVFVIGGAEVFREFLPLCSLLHVTRLDGEFAGDRWFPGGWPSGPAWVEEWRSPRHAPDGRNPVGMQFFRFARPESVTTPGPP
jgi:dihydrofolate reductase